MRLTDAQKDAMTERIEHVVVWTGSVFTASTRRDVVDLLRLEALV